MKLDLINKVLNTVLGWVVIILLALLDLKLLGAFLLGVILTFWYKSSHEQ